MIFKDHKTLYSYITVILFALLIILIGSQGTGVIGKTASFLFFIIVITFSAAVGGLKTGILTTLIAVFTAMLSLFSNSFSLTEKIVPLYEILLIGCTGALLSYVIEKYKKTNLENEYLKKEKENLKVIKSLEEENLKVKQEIRIRDEFLSIASHELKTPLTTMLLKIQLILHNIRNVSLARFSVENLLQMLETAEQQTQRLSRIITDLLSVSLITTGRLSVEPGKINLSEVVTEVVNEFSEKLQKDGYQIKLDVEKEVEIIADKMRIKQVVANLISNAIKYGNKKTIEVKVKKDNSMAKIIVKDEGLGIGPTEKDKIFELFERGGMNGSDIKGLGVGLFISNQIIKAHKGSIKVDSKSNSGSTFTVELPIK